MVVVVVAIASTTMVNRTASYSGSIEVLRESGVVYIEPQGNELYYTSPDDFDRQELSALKKLSRHYTIKACSDVKW
jgi:hypothetical protein